MRRLILLSFLLLTCACAAKSSGARAASPPTTGAVTISIVGTSDLHGGILANKGRGGLPLLGGYIENVRAARRADGGGVIVLDGGDLFQGTLASNLNEGAAVVAAYNLLGYTAAAIGNHEFDYGPTGPNSTPQGPQDDPLGALKARAAEARFPFLAANLLDTATGRPVQWPNVKPSTIVDVAGVKVGIIGVLTLEALSATMPANVKSLKVAPLAATLGAEAARLRQAGATVVIATAHAGGGCKSFADPLDLSSCNVTGEIFDVAKALPPGAVDAIVAGHRHDGIAHDVAGIPIVEAYANGRSFARIDLTVARSTGKVTARKIFAPRGVCAKTDEASGQCVDDDRPGAVDAVYEGSPVVAIAAVEKALAPAAAQAEALKARTLTATIEGDFPNVFAKESALGNLVTDWMRATVPNADLAVWNGGGIRTRLPEGVLTYGALYEVMPFDNLEAVVKLSGAALRATIAHNLGDRNGIMQISGVRATAACDGAELRVTIARSNGSPIADDEMLTMVTSDFLVTGGSDMFVGVLPFPTAPAIAGVTVRDRIADALAKTGGHWKSSAMFDASAPRLAFTGDRPVRCKGDK